MDRLYASLGRFVVRFRYLIVLGWIALTVVCVLIFPSLASVTKDFTLASLLPATAPSSQASRLAAPFQNLHYAAATLVAARASGPLTAADQSAIDTLENQARTLPHVIAVQDLALSPDGAVRQAQIAADVPPDGLGAAIPLVTQMRQEFAHVDAPPGLTFHLTGLLATTVDTIAALSASQSSLQNVTLLFIVVLLLVAFRSLLAPIVTLLPAVVVLLLASPVIAGAVTRLGVHTSVTTQFVLIVLILGAGTDYGLFLLFRVREEVRRGLAMPEAIVRAVQTVGETITFSALTVIVALTALNFAQLGLYQSLGPALAIGVALMLLAALTLLPAIVAIVGRAVFWPAKISTVAAPTPGLWGKLTTRFIQRPKLTLIVGVVIFMALAGGLIGTTTTASAGTAASPAGADSTIGAAQLAAHFPGATAAPTLVLLRFPQAIWNDPASIGAAQQQLLNSAAIRAVYGPLNPNGFTLTPAQLTQLHMLLGPAQALPAVPVAPNQLALSLYNAYRATGQYLSTDGLTAQFVVTTTAAPNSAAAQAAIPGLRVAATQATTAAGAVTGGVFSQDAVIVDVRQISQTDLAHLLPIVVALLAVLLALVLRSLIAPLYLVVSVVLSYFAALGLAGIVFVHMGGSAGVSFILPFALFVFLMALGSDYNILVMTRIREEARLKPLAEAVRDAIAFTGGTVTTAGVILAGTFTTLSLSTSDEQSRQFGFGIAAGLLLDTFLIRTLLIPALVVLLGRWNWWPSPLFHRVVTPATAAADLDIVADMPSRDSS